MNHLIAIDLGGTNIRTALLTTQLQVVRVVNESTIIGNLDLLLKQIQQSIEKLAAPMDDVLCISIGVPGRVSGTGKIDVLPNIKVFEVPLKSYLEKAFHKPVHVENDAVMAAIAEGNLGAGKNTRSSFFLTISTGIGGAFISNHQVKIASEEIGHMLVPFQGEFFELESIASGTGLVKLASLHGLHVPSPITLFDQVKQGVPLAQKTLESWLNILRHVFQFIQQTFEPEIIILTGGVLKSKALFLDTLKQSLPQCHIQFAQFGQDAGLMGAAEFGLMHHR